MNTKLSKDLPKFVAFLLLIIGVAIAVIIVRTSSDNRQRAASSTGTAKFLFTLPGGATSVSPGSPTTMTISATGTGQSLVDGFQLVATFTGSLPATMTMTPSTIAGLSPVAQSVTDVSGGKKLTLVFVTANPSAPFNANGGGVTLGTLQFTAPASGTMSIAVEQTMSKILQNSTGSDLLGMQNPMTVAFGSAATPTLTPTPTILPTPTTAPTQTPVPIAPGTLCTFSFGCTCTDTGRFMQNTWTCPLPPTVAPTPTVTPTPTATPIAGKILQFRAKFAGVTTNVGPITAKLTDAIGTTANLTFTFSSNGVYVATYTVPTAVAFPTSYSFALKPQKHLQRVFRAMSSSTLIFDVTSTPFQPGDLPPQDGIVDSTDINAVLSVLAKPTQVAGDLTTADMNYDGVVNAVDIGLILSTLSTKPDESL